MQLPPRSPLAHARITGECGSDRPEKARTTARQAAGRAAARELVAEYEAEHGPLPAASRQRARQFLIEAGLIDDEPQQAAG